MRIFSLFIAVLILFAGCNKQNDAFAQAMSIRSRLNDSGCEFFVQINADYGAYTYDFEMECCVDRNGEMRFNVKKPESISGITGVFDSENGKLSFDEKLLAFSPLSEGLLTPVASPWVFFRALVGGYISAAGNCKNGYQMRLEDTYEGHALLVEIITDLDALPLSAEIYWEGSRILSLDIEWFRIV